MGAAAALVSPEGRPLAGPFQRKVANIPKPCDCLTFLYPRGASRKFLNFHEIGPIFRWGDLQAMTAKKFATQIDEQVLKDLKKYVQESGRSISRVVSDAVAEHLQKVRVRPAFRSAMEEVLNDNEELLKRLAK